MIVLLSSFEEATETSLSGLVTSLLVLLYYLVGWRMKLNQVPRSPGRLSVMLLAAGLERHEGHQ